MKGVSLLLIIGGVVGIGLTFWLDTNFVSNGRISLVSLSMAITGAFIVVFGWAAWTGRDLWRGKRQAIRMSQILFAIQIPLIRVPGFAYELHTGFTVPVTITFAGGLHFNAGFNLGSSFSFYISSQIQDFAIGANLVAVFVLAYLMRISRGPGRLQQRSLD